MFFKTRISFSRLPSDGIASFKASGPWSNAPMSVSLSNSLPVVKHSMTVSSHNHKESRALLLTTTTTTT